MALLGLLLPIVLAVAAAPQTPALSTAVLGGTVEYEVAAGDTLTGIAAKVGVDPAVIAKQNPAATRRGVLKPGAVLHIDARHIVPAEPAKLIVINIAQKLLFLRAPNAPVAAYPIAVGRPSWRTPTGAFTVVVKERHPTWDVPVSIQAEMRRTGKPVLTKVPPGPSNPLGDYWMGLSLAGVGIHGTNAPRSVYTSTTHGCIRVHPDRVASLFEAVPQGAEGEAIYQPVLIALVAGRVFVEINRDIYGRGPQPLAAIQAAAARDCLDARIDWGAVQRAVKDRAGIAVDVTRSTLP